MNPLEQVQKAKIELENTVLQALTDFTNNTGFFVRDLKHEVREATSVEDTEQKYDYGSGVSAEIFLP